MCQYLVATMVSDTVQGQTRATVSRWYRVPCMPAGAQPQYSGVDSISILFNHCSFQKPIAFPQAFWWFSRKKDPWKEWKWKLPLEVCLGCLHSLPFPWPPSSRHFFFRRAGDWGRGGGTGYGRSSTRAQICELLNPA